MNIAKVMVLAIGLAKQKHEARQSGIEFSVDWWIDESVMITAIRVLQGCTSEVAKAQLVTAVADKSLARFEGKSVLNSKTGNYFKPVKYKLPTERKQASSLALSNAQQLAKSLGLL
jgi:hypothetical protein